MIWIRLSGFLMFLAIAFGAFGAHALKNVLSEDLKQIYQTAVLYHLIHGLALFGLGLLDLLKPGQGFVRPAGTFFFAGILLFSGSLYLLAITGIKKWGMVTPLGGLAFLAGWLWIFLGTRTG